MISDMQPRGMRTLLLGIGLLLHTGLALAAQICQLPDAPQSSISAVYAGRVFAVHGYASAKLPGATLRMLAKGDPVCEGDTVTTGEAALLQLSMADTGTLLVKPSTNLIIDTFSNPTASDGSEHFLVSLVKGGLRAVTGLIGRANKQNYTVRTATATIGIRGTDHEVYFVPKDSVPPEHAAEAGTYNRVFIGGTLLKTAGGELALNANQIGFAPATGAAPVLIKVLPSYLSSLNRNRAMAASSKDSKAKAGAETAAASSTTSNASDTGTSSPDSTSAAASAVTTTAPSGPVNAVNTTNVYVPITASAGGSTVNLNGTSSTTSSTSNLAPDNTAITATLGAVTPSPTGGQFQLGALITSGQYAYVEQNPSNGALSLISGTQQNVYIDLRSASLQSLQQASVDNVTVEWGLYTGGTAVIKDYPNGTQLTVFHFAMSPGGAATPSVIQSLSGAATYSNLMGSTAPTCENNQIGGALKSMSVSVSFGANPGITAYSLQVVDGLSRNWSGSFTGFASLGDFTNNNTNNPLTLNVSCSGANCGSGVGLGQVAGLLVGKNAGGMITSYHLLTNSGQSVMGIGVLGKH